MNVASIVAIIMKANTANVHKWNSRFWLLLFCFVISNYVQANGLISLNSTCDFESTSQGCGWRVLHPVDGITGITQPAQRENFTTIQPITDYNPGTEQGHYMYFTTRDIQQTVRILSYPSHKFVCAVSFAYYIVGPIDVELLRVNYEPLTLVMGDLANSSNAITWQRSEVTFNTSNTDFEVVFQVTSAVELGEAMSDPLSPSLFLGLDDIILTYCVSCDYSMLNESGAFLMETPEQINIRLRLVTQYNINTTIPMCPNETIVFSIVSVEPEHVSQIFSLDPDSGVLTVYGNGAGLDANGTNGTINVSATVVNSNYSYNSLRYIQTTSIPFTQPSTITYMAPSSHSIRLDETFSYNIMITTFLSRERLVFSQPTTEPTQLATDINITTSPSINMAVITVTGFVSIDRILPIIVEQNIVPSISIVVSDNYGGSVVIKTLLYIPSNLPPIFNQSDYTFNLVEESGSGTTVGTVALIDPNGHSVSIPMIEDEIGAANFLILPSESTLSLPAYTAFDIISLLRIDYERHTNFSFEISVVDAVDHTSMSAATVTVNIIPVNEFAPMLSQQRVEATINDIAIIGSEVATFNASDRDEGEDGTIVYSIIAGNDDGFFEVAHRGFGEIIVRSSPLLPNMYILTISATDQGHPPRFNTATLIVNVIATTMIDCSQNQFGPPYIVQSALQRLIEPVGSNVSLECVYTANPVARGYKWNTPSFGVITQNDSHYLVNEFALSISNLTTSDGGLYRCNVTNQCGNDTVTYVLDIIDVPGAPFDLHVTFETDATTIGLAWQPPSYTMTSHYVNSLLDYYIIEAQQSGKLAFDNLMEVNGTVHNVTITTLHPGTSYNVRVQAVNAAGTTPSETINITTNSSVPRLEYFHATGLSNYSILIEWSILYDGGYPITSFEINVTQTRSPSARTYIIEDIYGGSYVTPVNEQGHTYILSATAANYLGSSESQETSAFVGTTDSISCDFEVIRNCLWNIEASVIVQANTAPVHLPMFDSSENNLGFYVYSQVSSSTSDVIVLSYPMTGYFCGFSFSYWLPAADSNTRFDLRTSSGTIVWSTSGLGIVDYTVNKLDNLWRHVNTSQDQYYIQASNFNDQLLFIVSGDTSTSVAIDDITLKFCLPCDFNALQNESMFSVVYSEYNELYLRKPSTLTLQASVGKCLNVDLNASIIRVIPNDLITSLSVSVNSNHSIDISMASITTDLAEPGTTGLIEVSVFIVHSNYQPNSEAIERTVVLEFVLLEMKENCSILKSCDFESQSCDWQLGESSRIVNNNNSSQINTGSYLYSETHMTSSPVVIATAIINDDYCAVSFSYFSSAAVELEVLVDGLGVIWSSLLETTTPEPTSSQWLQESIHIDLQANSVQDNRSLSFQLSLAEGFGEAGLDDLLFVNMDNITLHPCIDCDTPECMVSSCIPGHYFSLSEEICTECPQGYYCPDWRLLPQPCPPGTFSMTSNSALRKNCLPCPNQRFTVKPGSISCEDCPAGYDCLNSSAYPVPLHINDCPTCQSCPVSMETTLSSKTSSLVPVLAVVSTLGGVFLCLCLLVTCLLTCCYKKKEARKDNSKHRKHLSRFDEMSIGSAGSLGRSSLASSSTFGSLGGGRKRWRGARDTQTLMSFLTDEEPSSIVSDPYYNESSWKDTEELTKKSGEPGAQETFVFKNTDFEDVSLGAEQSIELDNHSEWKRTNSTTGKLTSQF